MVSEVLKLRTTLRNNEMRVRNQPLTLVCVTQAERARIGYRYIHMLPSGIFVAKGVSHSRGFPISTVGIVNLLAEAREDAEFDPECP